MNKVSFYIPSYNSASTLMECLSSVLKQKYPIEEILIVDDGSVDGPPQLLKGLPVRLIKHSKNLGIAKVRNTAIANAKCEFIASVDADCILDESWLSECMKHFSDDSIVAVGGSLQEEQDSGWIIAWRGEHLRHHWGKRGAIDPIFLSGSNVVLRKSVVSELGNYDDIRFKTNYEDVDLSLRIKAAGFKLFYDPVAKAKHLKRDTLPSLLKSYWSWQYHDYKKKYVSRMVFNMINTIKLLLNDLARKKYGLLCIDLLTYPASFYFDLRRAISL